MKRFSEIWSTALFWKGSAFGSPFQIYIHDKIHTAAEAAAPAAAPAADPWIHKSIFDLF